MKLNEDLPAQQTLWTLIVTFIVAKTFRMSNGEEAREQEEAYSGRGIPHTAAISVF